MLLFPTKHRRWTLEKQGGTHVVREGARGAADFGAERLEVAADDEVADLLPDAPALMESTQDSLTDQSATPFIQCIGSVRNVVCTT